MNKYDSPLVDFAFILISKVLKASKWSYDPDLEYGFDFKINQKKLFDSLIGKSDK